MDIYKARNIQKDIVKRTKNSGTGIMIYFDDKLYYIVVAEVLSPERSHDFLAGQLAVDLGVHEATIIFHDYKKNIFHKLLFWSGSLCDLILIEIDD